MIGIALVLTHGTFCDGGDHGFNPIHPPDPPSLPREMCEWNYVNGLDVGKITLCG